MRKLIFSSLALVSLTAPGLAFAAGSKVGTLDCDVSAGIGVIVGSKQAVDCVFTPSAPGPTQRYKGSISDFGLDIGEKEKSRMIWLVFDAHDAPAGLEGTYAGVAADVSLGLGAGAKILVGGTSNSISLQPVAVEGDVGVNLAVGVASLTLRPVAN